MGEGNPDVQLPGACRAPPSAASRAAGQSSAPGTPLPHPGCSSNIAFSRSFGPQKALESSPNCSRVQGPRRQHIVQTTNALPSTPFGTLGLSILRPFAYSPVFQANSPLHLQAPLAPRLQDLNIGLSPAPALRHCVWEAKTACPWFSRFSKCRGSQPQPFPPSPEHQTLEFNPSGSRNCPNLQIPCPKSSFSGSLASPNTAGPSFKLPPLEDPAPPTSPPVQDFEFSLRSPNPISHSESARPTPT